MDSIDAGFSPVASQRIVIDAFQSQDDVGKLESSIVTDNSPVKTVKKRKCRPTNLLQPRSRRQTRRSAGCSTSVELNQNSEHLSQYISEVASSSQSSASSLYKTPIGVWVHQQDSAAVDDNRNKNSEISTFESPKSNPRRPSRRKKNAEAITTGSTSLLDSFKTIKARYDASRRLFAHDFRGGKYDKSAFLHLVIRKVVDRQEKRIQVIAYDVLEQKNRWVLFRLSDLHEIAEGVTVKLFFPWEEISLSESGESMIIGADFYKIIRSTDIETEQRLLKEMSDLPLPKPVVIRLSDPPFMDLVPKMLKNENTIQAQVERFCSTVNLDVLIVNMWTFSRSVQCLIKDSDDFMSFLEIPNGYENFTSGICTGKKIRLSNISVGELIYRSKKLAPFSIFHVFGAQTQTHFYHLWWTRESLCELVKLDISISSYADNLVTIEDIQQFHGQRGHNRHDRRVSLQCFLQEKGEDYVVLEDEVGRSLRVQLVLGNNFCTSLPNECNKTVLLKLLRLICGRSIWDQYTRWEDVEMEFDANAS